MSDRYKINPVRFIEWKTLILIQVKKQLESCKPYDFNSILSDPVVLADLKALHENYQFLLIRLLIMLHWFVKSFTFP